MTKTNASFGFNRRAAEDTISTLEELGRVDSIDAVRLASLRALADAVDSDPTNASLWREYRAEQALREDNDSSTDEFTQLLAALSAEVGDTETP